MLSLFILFQRVPCRSSMRGFVPRDWPATYGLHVSIALEKSVLAGNTII